MKREDIPLYYFMLLIAFASVGAVIPSAALLSISNVLHLQKSAIGLIINLFLLGYAFSQLLCAYVGTIIGRRSTLLVGTVLAAVGFLISSVSDDKIIFLVGRFLAGVGSGCGLAITFGLISDAYKKDEKKVKQVTAYTSSAFAVMPGVAVVIGSLISTYLGWRYINIFMLCYSFLIFVLAYRLPEFDHKHTRQKQPASLYFCDFKKYAMVSVIWGVSGGIVYMFSSNLSVISVSEFHLSSLQFGILYGISMVGYFAGTIVAGLLHKWFHSKQIVKIGLITNTLAVILLLIAGRYSHGASYFIPIFFLYLSFPLIVSTMIGQAMHDVEHRTVASAITGFLATALIVIIASGATLFLGNHHDALVASYLALALCSVMMVLTYIHVKKRWINTAINAV